MRLGTPCVACGQQSPHEGKCGNLCLQVLNKSGTSYTPKALPNFHILCDWGRLGLSATSTERICCFPGAHPKQDKLLTGDNRWGGSLGACSGQPAWPAELLRGLS